MKWGNEIGYHMLGIDLNEGMGDPLNYVRRVKETLDRKKISLEAECTHKGTALMMSIFGPRVLIHCRHKFQIENKEIKGFFFL